MFTGHRHDHKNPNAFNRRKTMYKVKSQNHINSLKIKIKKQEIKEVEFPSKNPAALYSVVSAAAAALQLHKQPPYGWRSQSRCETVTSHHRQLGNNFKESIWI